jgi:hypothetical protein
VIDSHAVATLYADALTHDLVFSPDGRVSVLTRFLNRLYDATLPDPILVPPRDPPRRDLPPPPSGSPPGAAPPPPSGSPPGAAPPPSTEV